MAGLLYRVNSVVTAVFSFLLLPFRTLDPLWPLVFLSGGAALVMLWAFKRFSNQAAVAAVRDRLRGHLLGVRLYRHDPAVVLGIQADVVRDTGGYLRLTLRPLLVVILPLALILIQAEARFSSRPLRPGETSVVTVRLASLDPENGAVLEASPGLWIETEGIRVPDRREISWRIRAVGRGEAWLQLELDGRSYRKAVAVGSEWATVPGRRGSTIEETLLNPSEDLLPADAPVRSFEVKHPPLSIPVWRWEVGWLTVFIVLSIGFALLLRRPLGVEI